eukprot:764155-Hanusia_phi.AAC.3
MGAVVALLVAGSEQFKGISCLQLLEQLAHKYIPQVPLLPYEKVPRQFCPPLVTCHLTATQGRRSRTAFSPPGCATGAKPTTICSTSKQPHLQAGLPAEIRRQARVTCCRCRMPALFAHAKDDQLIPASHSKLLMEAYAGEKVRSPCLDVVWSVIPCRSGAVGA